MTFSSNYRTVIAPGFDASFLPTLIDRQPFVSRAGTLSGSAFCGSSITHRKVPTNRSCAYGRVWPFASAVPVCARR
jgi:hypothetical protein